MGFQERLQKLDFHSSVSKEFRVYTVQGAALSILTCVAIVFLVYKEANYNFETVMTERVHVNATSPTGLDVEFDITLPKVPCNLLKIDANDPSGQPQSLHLDRRHHIWKHRVRVDERTDKNNGSGSNNGKNTKQRIKFIGNKRKLEQGSTLLHEEHLENELEKMKKEHGIGGKDDGDEESGEKEDGGGKGEHGHGDDAYDDDDDEYKDDNYYDAHEDDCGSCYGAGDEGECCDTCEDIKRVYQRKGWKIEAPLSFEQCKKELDHKIKMQEARKKKLAAIGNNKDGNNKDGNNKDNNNKDGNNKDNEKESEEGCNVHGLIALDSGGGNFHLAPGRSHDDANMGDIGAIFELLLSAFEQFNVTHTVHKIRFGDEFVGNKNQLDGETRVISDGYGMYQYYFKVRFCCCSLLLWCLRLGFAFCCDRVWLLPFGE